MHFENGAVNYILIDYENVQPRNLHMLAEHKARMQVCVFVGANQTKVSLDFAREMQALGDAARYVTISGHGKNALDFHIAFYAGELSVANPGAYFHIISRDAGFDPLIDHLRCQREPRIKIWRRDDIGEIPLLRISSKADIDDKIGKIIENLTARGQSRPRKLKTLTNTINTLFTSPLDETELSMLVKDMKKRGYIVINNENISYKLPPEA